MLRQFQLRAVIAEGLGAAEVNGVGLDEVDVER